MPSKIIARFKDGKVIKGTIADFYPNKDTFHLMEHPSGKGYVVNMALLKAIFFVKSFEGDKNRKRKQGFQGASPFGTRTVVKFHDGEIVYGYSQDYNPYAKGFFLFPDDRESNNTKIFIPASAVFDIKLGEDIDKSEYGKVAPKFLRKIVPKTINVSVTVSVGNFVLDKVKIKVLETNEVKESKKGEKTISIPLRPGRYNLEISYEQYSVTKTIDVDKEHNSFQIDLQAEMS